MSSKALSPAAQLLRKSRLMAMPNPVPPPPSYNVQTPPPAPYPTVQAITTPRSSAHRGDWGLKRDLPISVSKKTLYMRYRDLDTPEHMTTFESAHDDVFTLRKWQEMDIPLSRPSGFEDDSFRKLWVFDSETKAETYKWRHNGPFLADMTRNRFNRFIENRVKPRQAGFYRFVARKQTEKKLREHYATSPINPNATEFEAELKERAKDAEVDLLALRADNMLESLVYEFLDIPQSSRPMRTHPSAGLYYTRSDARAVNDPHSGPLSERPHVPGREMNGVREPGTQAGKGTMAGVGGVIAKVAGAWRRRLNGLPRTRFDVNDYTPLQASIGANGKIIMEVGEVMQGLQQQPLRSWGSLYGGAEDGRYAPEENVVRDKIMKLLGQKRPDGGMSKPLRGGGLKLKRIGQ